MRLAILIGHTSLKPGAFAVLPIHQTEYAYNSEIAENLYREAREIGIECRVFKRDGVGVLGAYAAINKWLDEANGCCIELHFNAAESKSAQGTETLYDAEPKASKELAEIIQRKMCEVFERTGKQNRGIKLVTGPDRGAQNLKLALHPSVLVEPFFGSNAKDASLGHNNRMRYAKALAEAAKEFLSQS